MEVKKLMTAGTRVKKARDYKSDEKVSFLYLFFIEGELTGRQDVLTLNNSLNPYHQHHHHPIILLITT